MYLSKYRGQGTGVTLNQYFDYIWGLYKVLYWDHWLTCDQVLVLVDVELHATGTLWGAGVNVLHVLHFVEAFVHLKDRTNKRGVKKWKELQI